METERPLTGIRVLDLTRVIAGPVATRALALLGAEVLRLDPPQLPELPIQHIETGQGKWSALLDLATDAGLARVNDLLKTADILVTGYRPGAIERYGFERPPGLVHARVSAWGTSGPWAHRRGFDSIVQAASGISLVEGDREHPGALPAQALDHASGYLLAAAALDALSARDADGRGRDVSVSLARTARHLLQAPRGVRTGELRQPAWAATLRQPGTTLLSQQSARRWCTARTERPGRRCGNTTTTGGPRTNGGQTDRSGMTSVRAQERQGKERTWVSFRAASPAAAGNNVPIFHRGSI